MKKKLKIFVIKVHHELQLQQLLKESEVNFLCINIILNFSILVILE